MSRLEMRYFMLSPLKDNPYGAASRVAIAAYATEIGNHDPELAHDLHEWLDSIWNGWLDSINRGLMGEKDELPAADGESEGRSN